MGSKKILYEEHHLYQLDCSAADWATDEIHDIYQNCAGSLLSDADFAFASGNTLYVVEYKNSSVNEKAIMSGFNPTSDELIMKIARKYYDSYFYFLLNNKIKGCIKYIYILEYPNGDGTSRRMLRNKIAAMLPFALQKCFDDGVRLIDEFEVLSIKEWNKEHKNYPLSRCKDEAAGPA